MLDENRIKELVEQLAQIYRDNIEQAGAVATGKLKEFTTSIESDNTGLSVYYTLPHYWKYSPESKFNNSRLATYPSGVKKPPIAMVNAIDKWLEIKGLPLNAWAVATTIANEGWKGQPKELLNKSVRDQSADDIIDQICSVYLDSMEEEIDL